MVRFLLQLIARFYRSGPDVPPFSRDPEAIRKKYEAKRWSVFLSITLGYGMFYVCRLSLSVVKKPMIDEGILNAEQMGQIGSALLAAYALGRFVNGFLVDRCNVRRFMATGLLVSGIINLLLGFNTFFWVFLIMWGLNGWFQSMGSAPSVVSLSQWFSNKERGTRYGIWSISHSIGEGLTFLVTSVIVGLTSWHWGFAAPGLLGIAVALILFRTLADRPATYGLPAIADYKNDHAPTQLSKASLWETQLTVLKMPAVWVLGLAGAMMYVARYAVNNWGILFLQEAKGYDINTAGSILGLAPVMGLVGSMSSGFISDRLFRARRNVPTLLYGILQTCFLAAFLFLPPGNLLLDYLFVGLFGFAMGGLVVFLGGLTAVDICPKRATGAAMGFIGLCTYVGAAIQDWVSGWLIHQGRIETAQGISHDFSSAIAFWLGASVLSLLLASTIWNVKSTE